MEQKDLVSFLDKESAGTSISADMIGRIVLADVEKIEPVTETFTKGDKQITSKRYMLTLKGQDRKVKCPASAMNQLNQLLKHQQIVAFTVLKTGSDLGTKYSIAPELAR